MFVLISRKSWHVSGESLLLFYFSRLPSHYLATSESPSLYERPRSQHKQRLLAPARRRLRASVSATVQSLLKCWPAFWHEALEAAERSLRGAGPAGCGVGPGSILGWEGLWVGTGKFYITGCTLSRWAICSKITLWTRATREEYFKLIHLFFNCFLKGNVKPLYRHLQLLLYRKFWDKMYLKITKGHQINAWKCKKLTLLLLIYSFLILLLHFDHKTLINVLFPSTFT